MLAQATTDRAHVQRQKSHTQSVPQLVQTLKMTTARCTEGLDASTVLSHNSSSARRSDCQPCLQNTTHLPGD